MSCKIIDINLIDNIIMSGLLIIVKSRLIDNIIMSSYIDYYKIMCIITKIEEGSCHFN